MGWSEEDSHMYALTHLQPIHFKSNIEIFGESEKCYSLAIS